PASARQRSPEPASATACQVAGRPDRRARPPRSGPDSAGTDAPTSPATRRPPSSTAHAPPSGSIHPETSASCGPVATSPGSSIRPLAGAQNQTTRVLPNPDNSCAYDNKVFEPLREFLRLHIIGIAAEAARVAQSTQRGHWRIVNLAGAKILAQRVGVELRVM